MRVGCAWHVYLAGFTCIPSLPVSKYGEKITFRRAVLSQLPSADIIRRRRLVASVVGVSLIFVNHASCRVVFTLFRYCHSPNHPLALCNTCSFHQLCNIVCHSIEAIFAFPVSSPVSGFLSSFRFPLQFCFCRLLFPMPPPSFLISSNRYSTFHHQSCRSESSIGAAVKN